MTINLSKVGLDKQKSKTRKLNNELLNQITGGYILFNFKLQRFDVYNNRTREFHNYYTDINSAEEADKGLNGFISWVNYGVPLRI